MSDHLIIALNREYGSGGKEIAEKLGKRLGLKVYDEDIADLAARRSGIRKDYFEKVDEKPTDSFLYMLAMNTFTMNTSMNPFENTLSSDKLFNKQAEVIQKTVSINQDIAESIKNENEQFVSINEMAESNANDTAEVAIQASTIYSMVEEMSQLLKIEE